MKLAEARRRLPVVQSLPPAKNRRTHASERLASGRPRPGIAVWELTSACDQGCLHCGPRSARARPDELTTDEALQLVADLAALGVGEVVLIGGEAYLRNDAVLIVRAIREHSMSCTMTTGAYNLNDRRLDALTQAGIQSLAVSIDGLEATHDHVRGRPGSWRRALSLLSRSRLRGIQAACNTQISGMSFRELPELVRILADEGLQAWQLQPTVPHGNATEHEELWIQPHEYSELSEILSETLDIADRRGVRVLAGNSLGYFGKLETRLRGRQRSAGHFTGCDAGSRALAIESNGAIKSCPSLGGAKHTGGGWREHGLEALWNNAPEIRWLGERPQSDLWGFCGTCYYAGECMAGCTAASESLLGRPGNNPFCFHRAETLAERGERERIVRVETSASPQPFDRGRFRLIRETLEPGPTGHRTPLEVIEG